MIPIVTAVAKHEFVVIAFELQRGGHLLVGQWPIPVDVVQIVLAVLQKNANRLLLAFSNQRFAVMPTSDVGKTANMAQDLPELVGPLPGDGPGTNASRTDTANGTLIRIVG